MTNPSPQTKKQGHRSVLVFMIGHYWPNQGRHKRGAPLETISRQELSQHDQLYDGWCALKATYTMWDRTCSTIQGRKIMKQVLGKRCNSFCFKKVSPMSLCALPVLLFHLGLMLGALPQCFIFSGSLYDWPCHTYNLHHPYQSTLYFYTSSTIPNIILTHAQPDCHCNRDIWIWELPKTTKITYETNFICLTQQQTTRWICRSSTRHYQSQSHNMSNAHQTWDKLKISKAISIIKSLGNNIVVRGKMTDCLLMALCTSTSASRV
jgi:hypothetical protein